MYTGKQQRDGVSVLPFLMPGLFQIESQGPAAADGEPLRRDAAAMGQLIEDLDDEAGDEDEAGYDADVEAAKVCTTFTFNWERYHAVWNETPIDKAIVEVFVEYAALYARISGQVHATVPPPMTLSTGLSIAEQASRFITHYVTPVLGEIQSTKIHKVLRHIMGAIAWHGHLQNGNTAENESNHKHDKPFYVRTNKHIRAYTKQLVVFARGSRSVLSRLDEEDARRDPRTSGARQVPSPGDSGTDDDSEEVDAASTRTPSRQQVMYHLEKKKVSALAALPDLADVGSLLGVDDDEKVSVMLSTRLRAIMDCGTPNVQTVRAAESFYGGPWYDCVQYQPDPGHNMVSVGEVRALVRLPVGDVAVLCEMVPVAAEPGCPFYRRGCTRLAWRVTPGMTRIALRVIPVSSIRRLLFVVPDFGDLTRRRGPLALPPGREQDMAERLAMRFFVNHLHPWELIKE